VEQIVACENTHSVTLGSQLKSYHYNTHLSRLVNNTIFMFYNAVNS